MSPWPSIIRLQREQQHNTIWNEMHLSILRWNTVCHCHVTRSNPGHDCYQRGSRAEPWPCTSLESDIVFTAVCEAVGLNMNSCFFASRVRVTTYISIDPQDAALNTRSRLRGNKAPTQLLTNWALTESVHLQLRSKCVRCSSQLVKGKSFFSLQHPFFGLSSLSVVNMLQKDAKLTGSVRYTPTHSPRPAAEQSI